MITVGQQTSEIRHQIAKLSIICTQPRSLCRQRAIRKHVFFFILKQLFCSFHVRTKQIHSKMKTLVSSICCITVLGLLIVHCACPDVVNCRMWTNMHIKGQHCIYDSCLVPTSIQQRVTQCHHVFTTSRFISHLMVQ